MLLATAVITAFVIGSSRTAYADRVDELAKCQSVFSIMTSLETYDARLGEHFTAEATFVMDLIGLYSQLDHGRTITMGRL